MASRVKKVSRLYERKGRAELEAAAAQRQKRRREHRLRRSKALAEWVDTRRRLEKMTKTELYTEACKRKILGRSKMNKEELIRALVG